MENPFNLGKEEYIFLRHKTIGVQQKKILKNMEITDRMAKRIQHSIYHKFETNSWSKIFKESFHSQTLNYREYFEDRIKEVTSSDALRFANDFEEANIVRKYKKRRNIGRLLQYFIENIRRHTPTKKTST